MSTFSLTYRRFLAPPDRIERRFKLTISVKAKQFGCAFSPLNEFRAIDCGNSLISGRWVLSVLRALHGSFSEKCQIFARSVPLFAGPSKISPNIDNDFCFATWNVNDVVRLLVLSSALKTASRFLPTGWMMNSGSQIRVYQWSQSQGYGWHSGKSYLFHFIIIYQSTWKNENLKIC